MKKLAILALGVLSLVACTDQRVVRSVAREEAEVAGYYEIMGEEKARPSIMDEQKAEVTEQTSPAEVPQEAAPAEVQQ